MIVCQSCGHQNDDGAQFCVSCRTYLEWTGERVPTETPPPPPPVEPAPQRKPGFVDHVRQAVGLDPRQPEPAPVAPDAVPAGVTAQPTPAAPAASGADQPVAMRPAQERDAPPPSTNTPVAAKPVDAVYCSKCGTANARDRQLCQSCGTELRYTAPVGRRWWQRLFRRGGRAAGERPGQRRRVVRRRSRRLMRGGIAVVVIGAVALVAGPWRGWTKDRYRDARALVTTVYDPVTATSATASSSAPKHPPAMAIDGVKDTAWSEGRAGIGVNPNETLTIVLTEQSDLARVGITSGASTRQKQFLGQPRPREIRLTFTPRAGQEPTEETITLKDKAGFQSFNVSAKGVTQVTLELLSVYSGPRGKEDTSIAEVEFFTKR